MDKPENNRPSRTNRWGYMAIPGYNPPNNDCPECTEPSRTWSRGARSVDGKAQYRYVCDNGHEWVQDKQTNTCV